MKRIFAGLAFFALLIAGSPVAAHEPEPGLLPLDGRFTVEVDTQHLGANSWRFTYTVTNITEVGIYDDIGGLPWWVDGVDHTGLVTFFVQIPRGVTLTNVRLPAPYSPGPDAHWELSYAGPANALYEWIYVWAYDVFTIHPVGSALVFGFDVEGVGVGTNEGRIGVFYPDHYLRWPTEPERWYSSYTTTMISPVVIPIVAIDQAVAAGTLVGTGPKAPAAAGRLGALRNMVEWAQELLATGATSAACDQLLDAYLRVDGQPKPPDFATGPAASEIAASLVQLRTALGCASP